jgi:hypothetical protein
MVNKNKVGNFQFLFGIILLIAAIVWIIISCNSFDNTLKHLNSYPILDEEMEKNKMEHSPWSNMTEQTRIIYDSLERQHEENTTMGELIVFGTLISLSLITFLISILFITQGLANKADAIEVKK